MLDRLKKLYWKLPVPVSWKVKVRSLFPEEKETISENSCVAIRSLAKESLSDYCMHVLNTPTNKSKYYCDYIDHPGQSQKRALVCAYYLTQYHPTEKNNLWWGKGTTEWTNVTKAVSQYEGHYQPRLAGELGYYDLRLAENMYRQIELAHNYGIDAFAFYYYWFNGERALELPFENFISHKDMNQKFCLCWCNEDWTKRYSGTSSEVLLSVGKSQDSYFRFLNSILPYFSDNRYLTIDEKYVLIIYRPSEMPDPKETIGRWREIVKEKTGRQLYLIASQERRINTDWTKFGFDAISQFHPASCIDGSKEITGHFDCIRKDFNGHIYDYFSAIESALTSLNNYQKIYPAVMPMWDNTSRRNNSPTIFEGCSPSLFGKWLDKAIEYTENNNELEERMVFVNAWNEWGEGAYLEPDRMYGYAFLEQVYLSNSIKDKLV